MQFNWSLFGLEAFAPFIDGQHATAERAYAVIGHAMGRLEMVSPEGDGEPVGLREFREEFFVAVLADRQFTLGELATAARLYAYDARNTDFELDVEEGSPENNPFLVLPGRMLLRAMMTRDREVRLACLKVVDSILSILRAEITAPLQISGDDGTVDMILRHETLEDILVVLKHKSLAKEIHRPFLEHLHYFTSGDGWRALMVDMRHPSEPMLDVSVIATEPAES